MWWYLIAGCAVLAAGILILISVLRAVLLEVQLFVQNRQGEYLLIYDAEKRRFKLPAREVPFDEIPTKILFDLMEDFLPGAKFSCDPMFHAGENKYDRIRDDLGPAYLYEVQGKLRKKCVFCYLLKIESYEISERSKKTAPFPEFYPLQAIKEMSEDIRPDARVMLVLERIEKVKGERGCC